MIDGWTTTCSSPGPPVGLVGDRYHRSRHRHATVQALDDLAAAAEALGRPVDPALTRRNNTLDHGPIPTRPGKRMTIGGVEVEVHPGTS